MQRLQHLPALHVGLVYDLTREVDRREKLLKVSFMVVKTTVDEDLVERFARVAREDVALLLARPGPADRFQGRVDLQVELAVELPGRDDHVVAADLDIPGEHGDGALGQGLHACTPSRRRAEATTRSARATCSSWLGVSPGP
jgi:hypothetical protein